MGPSCIIIQFYEIFFKKDSIKYKSEYVETIAITSNNANMALSRFLFIKRIPFRIFFIWIAVFMFIRHLFVPINANFFDWVVWLCAFKEIFCWIINFISKSHCLRSSIFATWTLPSCQINIKLYFVYICTVLKIQSLYWKN